MVRTQTAELTAGRAKNDMAKTEKHEATIFPIHVCGTVSPYPIVVTVEPYRRARSSHVCGTVSPYPIVVTVKQCLVPDRLTVEPCHRTRSSSPLSSVSQQHHKDRINKNIAKKLASLRFDFGVIPKVLSTQNEQ